MDSGTCPEPEASEFKLWKEALRMALTEEFPRNNPKRGNLVCDALEQARAQRDALSKCKGRVFILPASVEILRLLNLVDHGPEHGVQTANDWRARVGELTKLLKEAIIEQS